MTRDQIRQALLDALAAIAPEIEVATLEDAKPLRRQVDLDSADWLNFLVAVHESIGVEISDAEAARLATLEQLIDHCAGKLGA